MSYMSQQLLAAVRAMSEVDFTTLPSVQFIGKLREALIERGNSPELAEALAAKVDVTLPPQSLTEEEIAELAKLYADFIEKMKASFQAVGVADPTKFVLSMAAPLTLKLS